MKSAPENPQGNVLPPGIHPGGLARALELSGYPLQGIVAGMLEPEFHVIEEWGYIDRDTKEHRALDLYAHHAGSLGEVQTINPRLTLLIECKRSAHPYIFFRSTTANRPHRFPSISGFPKDFFKLQEAISGRYREISAAEILGLERHPFVSEGPVRCATFTKGTPSGDKVNLSGSDPFNSLVLPLTKALDHYVSLTRSSGWTNHLYPSLTLCISVLDAPMLVVDDPAKPGEPSLNPWVRIIRREANPDERARRSGWYKFYTVDAVHLEFFSEYVRKHILPFFRHFADRVSVAADVLENGGLVDELDAWDWDALRPIPKKA